MNLAACCVRERLISNEIYLKQHLHCDFPGKCGIYLGSFTKFLGWGWG